MAPEANTPTPPPGMGPNLPVPPPGSKPPTDEQLTGGRGDNLAETVQEERVGTTDPGPRNRMVAENATDLDASTAGRERELGNRYGTSSTAAANFARDARQEADRKLAEARLLIQEADRWLDQEQVLAEQQERDAEALAAAEREREATDHRMERVAESLARLAEKMEGRADQSERTPA